jgi:hypothetical protein
MPEVCSEFGNVGKVEPLAHGLWRDERLVIR